MPVHSKDFVDLATRARELGCRVPVRVAILPGNFSTAANTGEFCYHAATPHVRSAWRSVGFEDEGPDPARDMTSSAGHDRNSPGIPDRVPSGGIVSQAATNNENAKVPLVAFFGAGLLGGPEWCLTVALSMISRVLALDPCCASPREVRFDAIVERPGGNGYACLEYRGDAYELVALAREVRGIWAGK